MTPQFIAVPDTAPKNHYVISSPTGFHAASGRYQAELGALEGDRSIEIVGSVGRDAEKLALLSDDELRRVKTILPG